MRARRSIPWLVVLAMILFRASARAQEEIGSVRGVVFDKDFDVPLAGAEVLIIETQQKTLSSDQGTYVFNEIEAGIYTFSFSKDGYVRQTKANFAVAAGEQRTLDISLPGDFTDLEEYIVQDILAMEPGSEEALLQLRIESPALMNSISADLISQAGASDAAGALRLVAGASVQDGRFAVIRGLPDRYVSSQVNGVRAPSADEDKRAVELDQYPSAVLQRIDVFKTFTPDRQGDSSGGAVDIRLRGIPDRPLFIQLSSQIGYNSQVRRRDDFLGYDGGGVSFWGRDDGGRDIQFDRIGKSWSGAVGTEQQRAPIDHKWTAAVGGSHEFDSGVKVGGFASFFYERDSSFFDDGVNDQLWVDSPGDRVLTPRKTQNQGPDDFKTALFDIVQGTRSVQWGGLGTFGVETENHALNVAYLFTRTTEDKAILAEDTRGKEFFFPGYDIRDKTTPGHSETQAAPYLRTETLEYTERETSSLQFHGRHTLPFDKLWFFDAPELDWTAAFSTADMKQPDKRLFGSLWIPGRRGLIQPRHRPFRPDATFTLGNLQRIFKEINEDSQQYSLNLKLPFEQWTGNEGYVKAGWFIDRVDRDFTQETFSNSGDSGSFIGAWRNRWSRHFPNENHPIQEIEEDLDYKGEQDLSAWYGMAEVPLFEQLTLVGGARVERTEISTVITAEDATRWFPPNESPRLLSEEPGAADVSIDQKSLLPSLGLIATPVDELTFRASYGETVARPTFKELTPVLQQEFLGGPVFVGNPFIRLSSVQNYDLRVDYSPYEDGLISGSLFYKEIDDPIEYLQKIAPFNYTFPENYPEGWLSGAEVEVRHHMANFLEELEGLTVGANATFINSQVQLPATERRNLRDADAPMNSRAMLNAPEYLYNIFITYDVPEVGTQLALFYTVQGDTLIVGAGVDGGNFVPSIFAKEFETLNFTATQPLGEVFRLRFQAKNLTNPEIETIYRSQYIDNDTRATSFTRGVEYSLSLTAELSF